jgi:hypothetical protein
MFKHARREKQENVSQSQQDKRQTFARRAFFGVSKPFVLLASYVMTKTSVFLLNQVLHVFEKDGNQYLFFNTESEKENKWASS